MAVPARTTLTIPSYQLFNTQEFKFLGTTSCAMSHGPYSSLSLEPGNIPLLRLIPDKDETAPIQCRLFNYSLQELGKGTHLYEALSYVWGGSDKPRSISMGEHTLSIRVNLHAALSRLRDRALGRILWVDALCIDQANLKERGQQVRLMAKIYSKAIHVIVWLGEMADDSDREFDAIRIMAERSDQALEGIRVAAHEESTNSLNSETIQHSSLALLQRPWFQRIWVSGQTLDIVRRVN
jgi:hypothetical protein